MPAGDKSQGQASSVPYYYTEYSSCSPWGSSRLVDYHHLHDLTRHSIRGLVYGGRGPQHASDDSGPRKWLEPRPGFAPCRSGGGVNGGLVYSRYPFQAALDPGSLLLYQVYIVCDHQSESG